MQQSRLGVSVGLVGAALCLSCFFGGYVAAIILLGYILLFEENMWLKRISVKAVATMFGFSILSALIGFIPNIVDFIDTIFALFDETLDASVIRNIVSLVNEAIVIIEKLVFLTLGIKALNQGTLRIPVIDSLVNKYMN